MMFGMINAFVQNTWGFIVLLLVTTCLAVKQDSPSHGQQKEPTRENTDGSTSTRNASSPVPVPVHDETPTAAPDRLPSTQLTSCLQVLGDLVNEIRRSSNDVHEAVSKIHVLPGLADQMQAVVASAKEARKGEAEANMRVRRLEAQVAVDRHVEKRLTRIEARAREQEVRDDDTHGRLSRVEGQLNQSTRVRNETINNIRARYKQQRRRSMLMARMAHLNLTAAHNEREKMARRLRHAQQDLAAVRVELSKLEMWKADATSEYRRMVNQYAEESRLAREMFEDHRELCIEFEASRDENIALCRRFDALQAMHNSLLAQTTTPLIIGAHGQHGLGKLPDSDDGFLSAAPTMVPTNFPPICLTTKPLQINSDLTSSSESSPTMEIGPCGFPKDTRKASGIQLSAATPCIYPASTTTPTMQSAKLFSLPVTPPVTPVVLELGTKSISSESGIEDVSAAHDDSPASGSDPFIQSSSELPHAKHHCASMEHKVGSSRIKTSDSRSIKNTEEPIPNTKYSAEYSAAYLAAWRRHITSAFNAGHFARAILDIGETDEADDVQSGWVARVRARGLLDMETGNLLRSSASCYSAQGFVAMASRFFREVVWVEFRSVYGDTVGEDEFHVCWDEFRRGVEAYMAEHPADTQEDGR